MPMYQKRALQSETTLANDAGTFTLKLPKQGALSALEIFLQATNGATNGIGVDIFSAFDKIEIIANGSYQIFSMTPAEAFTWGWLHQRRAPYINRDQSAAAVQSVLLSIPFGLPMFNNSHFLPLGEFRDLELRITYSPTISATAGFATGTCKVSVYGWITDANAGLAFAGYLRNRTVYTFTSAASGVEKIEIDGQFPVLGLQIYAYEVAVNPHANLTLAEMLLRDGASVHFTDVFANIRRQNMVDFMIDGNWSEIGFGGNTDPFDLFTDPSHLPTLHPQQAAPTLGTTKIPHFRSVSLAGNRLTLSAFNDTVDGAATDQAAYTTDTDLHAVCHANEFPRGAIIPFGYPDKLDMMLTPSMYDQVHLELTNGNAGADVRVSQLELAQVSS